MKKGDINNDAAQGYPTARSSRGSDTNINDMAQPSF